MAGVEEVHLKPNRTWDTSVATFGVVDIDRRPDQPLTVDLAVLADGEHDFLLQVGDTFTVRDQVWRLERVDDPQSPNWTVVLVRVS